VVDQWQEERHAALPRATAELPTRARRLEPETSGRLVSAFTGVEKATLVAEPDRGRLDPLHRPLGPEILEESDRDVGRF
jgi:hypothetical protein